MAENNDDVTFIPEEEAQKQSVEPTIEAVEEGIKSDLEEIKHLTGDSRAWFWRGMMQGAGAIIGSILTLILLGWVLSILGVIPGVREISDYVSGYLDQVKR